MLAAIKTPLVPGAIHALTLRTAHGMLGKFPVEFAVSQVDLLGTGKEIGFGEARTFLEKFPQGLVEEHEPADLVLEIADVGTEHIDVAGGTVGGGFGGGGVCASNDLLKREHGGLLQGGIAADPQGCAVLR